jgi:hypothetical protein
MKKTYLFTVLLLVFHGVASAQPTQQFRFLSYMQNLFVTPGEQLVLTTKAGEVAFSNAVHDSWHMSSPRPNSMAGTTLENAIFFNKDTGLVSGFISDSGKYNIIYHTTDAGATWKKTNMKLDGWADAACGLDSGEAWMSIGGKGIVYTADYGFTWTPLGSPDNKQRFTSLFFNIRKEGIAGSVWNALTYTTDNGLHWKKLPTPLDQQQYNKTDATARPEINTVAIYRNHLLIAQEDMVFYSRKDTIQWIAVPDYKYFATDAANSALYLIKNNNQVVLADEQLKPLFTYPVDIAITSSFCRNSSLFIKTEHDIFQYKADHSLVQHQLRTKTTLQEEMITLGYNGTYAYAAAGNVIYTKFPGDNEWKKAFSLPFPVQTADQLRYQDETFICRRSDDSVFYYYVPTRSVKTAFAPDLLNNFGRSGINTIIYSTGSYGCFHSFSDELIYKQQGNKLLLTDLTAKGNTHKPAIKKENTKLDTATVQVFTRQLPGRIQRLAAIDDLNFSEDDYRQCKADIIQFREHLSGKQKKPSPFSFARNNLDLNKLISLVDSVRQISPTTLSQLLCRPSPGWSTTTNWRKVTIIDKEGHTMHIENRYRHPNAYYIPWTITLDNISYRSIDAGITGFIRLTCPSLLKETNKMPVLYELVKGLYK